MKEWIIGRNPVYEVLRAGRRDLADALRARAEAVALDGAQKRVNGIAVDDSGLYFGAMQELSTAIEIGGPDAVRERYLPQLFAGEKLGAYGLSEPGAGRSTTVSEPPTAP